MCVHIYILHNVNYKAMKNIVQAQYLSKYFLWDENGDGNRQLFFILFVASILEMFFFFI